MSSVKCIYHRADLDGIMSGFIVKRNIPSTDMFGIDYTDDLSNLISNINDNDTIYIVDLSIITFIETIIDKFNNLNICWIDHHQSSIDNESEIKKLAENKNINISNTVLDIKESACSLCYRYFASKNTKEDFWNIKIPIGIKLLSDYDTGKYKDNRVFPFQYGVRSFNSFSPTDNTDILNNIYNEKADLKEIINKGKIIINYMKYSANIVLHSMLIDIDYEGYKCIGINQRGVDHRFLDKFIDDSIDIFITFYRENKKWVVSLRSLKDDINVGRICSMIPNGGGHKAAGGFVTSVLPFST